MSFHSSETAPVCSAAVDTFTAAIEAGFDFGSEEYQLFHQRSATTAFQGSRWLDALHRDVAPSLAAEPLTVTAREQVGGRLVLVLPLVRCRRNGLTFVEFADFGLCDYLTAVYDPHDAERLVADAALPSRVAALLPPFDVVSLTKLAGNDPILERLFPSARRARMRASAHAVKIGTGWAEWRLATFDRSLRHELDIKRRRFAKAGTPAFKLVDDASEIVRVFDALRSFRSQRFKKRGTPDVIDSDAVFSFYRRIAIEGAGAGTARTFCLYLSGEPVAVMFGLVHRRTFCLLLVGFDLVRYRRLSVGLLAIEDTLRASIEAGDAVYDFTIGDYAYKLQFGGEPTPLYEWRVARTIRGRLAVFGIEAARETKRVLKPLVIRARRSPLLATVLRLSNPRRKSLAS